MTSNRILIIEDTPANMELFTDLLEAAGHTVSQAWEATGGLELARAEHPDLILMDIGLPGMDGLAATRALKADAATRDIPVLALTAHAMRGEEEKAAEAGCAGYMTKPIQTRAFVKHITDLIEATQSRAAL